MRFLIFVAIAMTFTNTACTPANVVSDAGSSQELCQKGYARACATQYKHLYGSGRTNDAEKLFKDLCKMPRILCYQLKPEENFSSDSKVYEKILEQDVWNAGRVTEKRVVLLRTIEVSADHFR